ncbi:MAG: hypothetical protein JNK74_00515 [Candidatus Hydrogenedentes bacterium]|nr:hypothetical protein [Candidatus Hydrogenedentota bacterium]
MSTPQFTDKARAAFILLLEEYAANHVDPPGFDDGQEQWDHLKADPDALDRQIAYIMNDVYDIVYTEIELANDKRLEQERAERDRLIWEQYEKQRAQLRGESGA